MEKIGMRRTTLSAASAICLLFPALTDVSAEVSVVGSVTNIKQISEGNKKQVVFTSENAGACVVIPFAPDLIRVRCHWDFTAEEQWQTPDMAIAEKLEDWPDFPVEFRDANENYYITTDQIQVEVVKGPNLRFNFKHPKDTYYYLSEGVRLEYDKDYSVFAEEKTTYRGLKKSDMIPWWYKVRAVQKMPAEEVYFGLGEVPYPLQKGAGTHVQFWNADTFMWNEYKNPMYMSLPLMYGVRPADKERPAFAYGIFFNNPARPVFMFGKERQVPRQSRFNLEHKNGQYSFEAGDGQIDFFFFGGGPQHTMKEVLSRYSQLTGLPTFLPKWAYGHHMSRWSYNQDEIKTLIKEHRQRKIPLDAVYLDIDYFDQSPEGREYGKNDLHQLTFNKEWNPELMFQHATKQHVRLIPLIEAWLTNTDPMFNKADNKDYFIQDENGKSKLSNLYFGRVGWIDFTNRKARDWWKKKVREFLDKYPFAGIWNDLNEPADEQDNNNDPLPLASRYAMSGHDFKWDDSRRWHHNIKNTYNLYETKLTYETLQEKYPAKRPFVLSRSAWPGIQRYALNWSGDNKATWEHLRINIKLGLNTMISGQVNFGHDVGGFVGEYDPRQPDSKTPSPELMTRWIQFAALTPFFRNHSILGDYSNRQKDSREIYTYNQPYQDIMIESVRFRYKLMPYLYSLAYHSTISGIPMNMPKFFIFTDDTETYSQKNDYDLMVGDYLLAAPIYEQGKTERWVYLPKATQWYDWRTDQKYNGGWTKSDAPIAKLPLFVRQGAIIPMGPVMEHVEAFKAGSLNVHVWPGASSEFTLFEDDGVSWNYKQGEYAKTTFSLEDTDAGSVFTVQARAGSFDTGRSAYILIFHDMDRPSKIHINDTKTNAFANLKDLHSNPEGSYYDSGARKLTVKVEDNGQEILLRLNR
ncbi:MAG: DUF5110 domain-containing protein [Candidatus Electrothrix sp. AR4]|nr:DUF5110 domain-containing protein [Candidatus Electrothrix sp. AR4]